jgi:hypothetical protein
MKVGKGSTRLKLGLVFGVALLAFAALFVSGASAQNDVTGASAGDLSGLPANMGPFDPQETNVPYLAWRGENVKLVDCIPHDLPIDTSGATTLVGPNEFVNNGVDVTLSLYDYTTVGPDGLIPPAPMQNSVKIFYDYPTHRICASEDWNSAKAGIAIFKLSLSYGNTLLGQHDFMVGWMNIASATITNAGSVTEDPGTEPGNSVNVLVTGSIPDAEFAQDFGLPNPLVMPDDWAAWANAMATVGGNLTDSSNPYFGVPASAFWDIHDSSGPLGVDDSADVHVNTHSVNNGGCGRNATPDPLIDQVDNCKGGESDYSRVFGDFGTGVGPFDPSYSDTLLSDGRLNANDAPMPALPIVFNSVGASVTTANGTFSGDMGGYENSCLNDKDAVYNRLFDPTNPTTGSDDSTFGNQDCLVAGTTDGNATGQESGPHNLYAPYYDQFVPATSRDPNGAASGTDAALFGSDNFTSLSNWYGLYENWEIASILHQDQGGNSHCLLTTGTEGANNRQLNTGNTSVVEFTDEHGEARAQWTPGVNADFFAAYANNNGQGGCDLEGITFPQQTLTATAYLPEQQVASPVAATGSIIKNINNNFAKNVSCTRKSTTGVGVTTGTLLGYVCTASAIDIDNSGAVFNGEKVCLVANGTWFAFPNGGAGSASQGSICGRLEGGDAGVPATFQGFIVATDTGVCLDVLANFIGENIERDTHVTEGDLNSSPGECGATGGAGTTTGGAGGEGTTTGGASGTTTGGASGTTTGGASGTTTGGASGTTTGGTTGSVDSGNNTTTVGVHKVSKTARVSQVQLRMTRNGRVLYVRIVSPRNMAKIRVSLIVKGNKVMKNVMRNVKTNQRVKVQNLLVSKQVKHVRVTVLH